MCVAGLTLTLR